jgi:hypothetical protein
MPSFTFSVDDDPIEDLAAAIAEYEGSRRSHA